MEWRERRKKRKAKEAEEKRMAEIKKVGIKVPKAKTIMSGKALFVFNPTLFKDADDAADTKDLKEEVTEEEQNPDLEKGGKKWEAKKVEVIEEKDEDIQASPEKQTADKPEENKGEEDVKVDEELFADEEELPDDI